MIILITVDSVMPLPLVTSPAYKVALDAVHIHIFFTFCH